MNKPEEESQDAALFGSYLVSSDDVFQANIDNSSGNQRFDDAAGNIYDIHASQCQRDGMGDGEEGDNFYRRPKTAGDDEQGKQEQQVIVAGEDMLHAQLEKINKS